MPPRVKKKKYPEDQLIRLIREQHPNGAAALYDMYGASLYGVIARIIPDTMRSEDVLQETFLKIWQCFAQYDPAKGRLYTWMFNIARRQSIDTLRSKSYRQETQTTELSGNEEFFVGPEVIYNRIDNSLARLTVGLLQGSEKKIVELIYYGGYTHAETAETLSIPLGTVKTRLARALKRLRAYYAVEVLPLAS